VQPHRARSRRYRACEDVASVTGNGAPSGPHYDLWSYDNTGLKLAQIRFYQVATDTN
jgi:hypothetical protein